MQGHSAMADLSDLGDLPPQGDRPRAEGSHNGERPGILHRSRRPPAPVTVDALRERLVSMDKPGRIPAGKAMYPRVDMETNHGADSVMAVAAMAAQIHGFPDDVVVSAPDAKFPRRAWVAIQRQGDGVWRIVTERPDHPNWASAFSGWNRGSLVHMIARAMGVPRLSDAGYDTLASFGAMPKRPEEVEPFIAAIEGSVPAHVLRVPLRQGFGSDYRENATVPAVIAEAWVKAMVARGVDVNQPGPGEADPPFLAHVEREHVDRGLVRALLDAGADIDARGYEGMTALLTTLRNGRFDIARLLLEKGAKATLVDHGGSSAVDHLIAGLHKRGDCLDADPAEIARTLIDAGCVEAFEHDSTWAETLGGMIDDHVAEPDEDPDPDLGRQAGMILSTMRKVLAVVEEVPSAKPR